MSLRNALKDKIAIVGVGTTKFARDAGGKTGTDLLIEAARNAVLDAGLKPSDIDGIGSSKVGDIQEGLGIPEIIWQGPGGAFALATVASAVLSGSCTTALLTHGNYRNASNSRSAANDPFRARASRGAGEGDTLNLLAGSAAYAAYASRYMYEFKAKREYLGLVAINERTNASMNEHAVMRTPITMEDYLSSRMVREPLCLLDMDVPLDFGDAFVVTTAERAKDLKKKPVYIHAATFGQTEHPVEESFIDLYHTGHNVAAKALLQKSDLQIEDMDIYFPYDGFTIITLNWIESIGWCKKGEAGPFLEHHWDKRENRVKINGRILMNTHGGNHSEGATQGSGHLREATQQLRGEAGIRQAPNCKTAFVTIGGVFFNANAFVLRTD